MRVMEEQRLQYENALHEREQMLKALQVDKQKWDLMSREQQKELQRLNDQLMRISEERDGMRSTTSQQQNRLRDTEALLQRAPLPSPSARSIRAMMPSGRLRLRSSHHFTRRSRSGGDRRMLMWSERAGPRWGLRFGVTPRS